MTDREFEKWYVEIKWDRTYHTKELMQYAWQARGGLDAVRIKELEAELAIKQTMPMKYKRMAFNAQLQKENDELTAKLDKAKEYLLRILVSDCDFAQIDAIANEALEELDK